MRFYITTSTSVKSDFHSLRSLISFHTAETTAENRFILYINFHVEKAKWQIIDSEPFKKWKTKRWTLPMRK